MLKDAFARLSRHTLVYALAGQLSRVVGFLLVPFYTEHILLDEYGINALLTKAIAVLGYLAGINMTSAMARYYFEQAEPGQRRLVVSTTLWSVLVGSAVLGGGLALFAEPLGRLLDATRPDAAYLVLLTLGILVLQLLREVWWRYLQTENRSTSFAVFAVGKVVVEVSLQVWFIAGLGRGLAGLFEAVLISEALSVLALSLLLLPRTGVGFSRPIFLLLFAFTLPLIPNGLLQFCLHSADSYLVKALAGNDEVGLYDFGYRFGYIPNYLLLTPFLMVWYPYVFSLGNEARQREIIGRFAPYFLFALTAVVLVVALVAEELAVLMAGDPVFLPGWKAIAPVCLGYWFWGAFQLVQTGFYVRKATGKLPALTGIAAVANVLLNLALIPRFGFLGAAWATAATFLFLLLITARSVRRVFPVEFPWRRIVMPAVWAAVALGAGWLLADWALAAAGLPVPMELAAQELSEGLGSGLLLAVSVKLAVALLWLVCMWRGGFLGAEERAALRGLLPGGSARRGEARAGRHPGQPQ